MRTGLKLGLILGSLTACLVVPAGCETPTPGPVGTPAPAHRQCFSVRFLRGFETIDRDTLRVRAGADRYDLDLSGAGCDRIEWTQEVAVESSPSSSWICVGDAPNQGLIAFRLPETRGVVECRIADVRAAEAARPD